MTKIGQDLKFDWQIFARRGIEVFPYDDTMLMSYVLDAGKGGHGLDGLADKWLGHQPIPYEQVTGTGKNRVTFDGVTIEKAGEYAAERADVTLRLWKALQARMPAEHVATVYETLERPLVPVLARMEGRGIAIDRQVLSRLSGEFAQRQGGLEDEINKLAGARAQSGQPEAARRRAVRPDGTAGRHQDQDRTMGDRREGARGAGRAGPRAAAADSRLAAGFEAALDLHRRAAELSQCGDQARPHLVCAGRDADRPSVVVRAEPAEHPGPHRGRPQDPPRLHRRAGHQARLRRLLADRTAAARRDRQRRRNCRRRSATASTFTP